NILYGYTDKYLENENARVKVAEIIEDILTKNIKNFNYNINSDLLRAPALALDSEGRLKKTEFLALVKAFNKLDLESFNELTSISLNYIINDLGEARVVTVFEELLESEWAYFIIGRALRYEGLLELLAEEATKRLKKITDVEHEFSVSDFDIREAKYGIFETSGEYEGYVARTELLALVKLVFAYDWLAIKADSLVSIDNLVRDFLGYTDEAVIDKLLDSKVVVALLDKLLNVETNNLGSYYIEVLNKQLAKRSLTEGLVLGDNIFNISGISGADEVIKTSEIKGLLEIVYLLNLSEGINVERAFTIYSADRNGNDESDFIEIFERTAFIRGLISNVYKDENVKEFALELVEDKVDPKVKEISLLKDLEVDYQLIVEALFAILDENGEFDYLDIGRVLAVLNELNVKGTNDLKLSLVDEVRNNTIDSEDMIYYLANTKAVRYVLSSVLKQPELFSFAAKLVNEKLNTNLETDYQIGSEYDDLLDGYISATHLEALLRAGIGLDISALRNVSLDNLYEIVVGLLDDPYVREGSRLYFVYESLIITDLIKLVVENEALQDWGIGKVNTYLEKVINKFELTDIELLTSADLMISYEGLFDYEAALALLEAVSELNVTKTSDLTKARSINDVAEILKLPYGRETAEELFETPQVRHFIEVFANHDLGYQIVSGIINKYAKKVNLEVSAEDLKVDASYFTSEELTTLLIALYMSGYDVGMAITPALIKNLEEFVVYLNISQERLYFFLDSVIITKLINKAINSENLKGKLLAKVEDKLNDVLNTNLEIPVSLLRAPSVALDGEGNLLRTEIMALVKAFNSLGLGSFNEVTRYTEPRYITENVDTDALLDELLKSEWAYFVIGKAISNDEVLELVAKIATKVVSKLFKEDHQFEAADFYFDDSRYDVLIESGKYEGYLEKEEIKLLARLALEAVPYYDSFSGLGSIPGVIKEMFNDLDENDKSYIDRLFESELFVAAMDKVFNIEHSTMTTNIETLYLSILNSKLSSKGLTLVADDNIFEYHDDVYDNNMMVKKEEVRLLLAAITYLDISDIGLKMILDLVNDEDEEGKTSFDHIFESLIIHSVVSKMMLNERILGVVVDKVNSRQDTLTFTIDLIEVPSEMVEEDLVSVDELKKVLEAFNLMGIESLDLSSVGVEMITNLYGANEVDGKDDLDRLLDSLYIYVIIDRMLKGEAIGNLIATMASGMLDKDITYFDTTPQDDHLDANGGIKKDELRAAVYSLVLLDLTGMPDGDSVTLTDLLALIDQNTDPMTNVDDMHRFLAGDYFHYILQKALTSLSFREMVADGAEIEVDDFDLVSAKDDDGIMSKTEVYNLFRGLKILGINDFSNVEFDIETIINLDTIDFDLLFESSFIYQIIDLTIKDQLDDIPEGALVEDINSKYYDYVKKDELRALLEILKELDATDPNDINADNVTVGMLRNFLDKDSAIFNRFLSEQIIEELGALNEEAYVSGSEKDLTPDELRSFVEALEILLGSEQSLGDLDFGELTVTTNQFNDVLNIEADNDGTHVVNRMLSKAIIEGIDDIPEAAYVLDSDDKDIERTEIEGLQKVINILKLENMSDDINVDIVSVDDLGEIVDVNTLIVNKLVSDSIKEVFDDIPAAALDSDGVVLNSEMKRIVASLT
ncbi:MAG: hypothetical protein M0P92_06560, partial [Acholeplasmataceae bacterium]|nr:hypothetical protein [Acholeplasmataceae bacterium]